MNTKNMTTEELKKELDNMKVGFDCSKESWNKVFEIEKELKSRGVLLGGTYNWD